MKPWLDLICAQKQVDSLLSKKPGTPAKLFNWYYSIVEDNE